MSTVLTITLCTGAVISIAACSIGLQERRLPKLEETEMNATKRMAIHIQSILIRLGFANGRLNSQ
jgi:hypothetical protein